MFSKKAVQLSLCFAIVCTYMMGNAQQRFVSRSFENINIESNIVYAIEDSFDFMGFGIDDPEPLRMDVYYPLDDAMSKRPLVVCLFGGAFLAGSKERSDMKAWCDSLAHYGYVAVAINYRLGFNPLASAKGIGADESVIRALYRSTQDCRAAVRYMINQHERFHIDTTCIFLIGNSAGAITAINAAFMKDAERPAETLKTGYGANNCDLGCLDCTGSFKKNEFRVSGIVSLWGASIDLNIIDKEEEIPLLFIHGTADVIVPYNQDYALNFTMGKDLNVFLYGSKAMQTHCEKMGWNTVLIPYEGKPHCFYACGDINVLKLDYEIFPCEYWWPVFYSTIDFLRSINPHCIKTPPLDLNTAFDFVFNELGKKRCYVLVFSGNLLMNNELIIYNAIGDVIVKKKLTSLATEINLENKPAGMYFAEVKNHAHSVSQKILLK